MPITLEALHVIDIINRKGSFSAAAKYLQRVPSALSYTIHKLEKDLDIKIFDRTGHHAVLTAAGEKLLEEGRVLLGATEKLEKDVKFIHSGWESKLNIVLGELVKIENILPVINDFYSLDKPTQLTITSEVLSGTWDALVSRRADIAVGAAFEGPPTGGYIATRIGTVKFLFVVSPKHPLAKEKEPLHEEIINKHVGVVAMDSSRNLPPTSAGVLYLNQPQLKVNDLHQKLAAYRAGVGIGTLPRFMVEEDIQQGRLISKRIHSELSNPPFYIAMSNKNPGSAAKWFYRKLCNIYLYEDLYL